MLNAKTCLLAAAALTLLLLVACDRDHDPRYSGWNRYTDEDDGYVILLPPGWVVEGEMMQTMRGVRLYDKDMVTPPLAGRVYCSIYAKDRDADAPPFAERATALVDGLLRGLWCDNQITQESGNLAGLPATRFAIAGYDCAVGISQRALVMVLEAEGKDFILFATSTNESWLVFEETFQLMYSSFELVKSAESE